MNLFRRQQKPDHRPPATARSATTTLPSSLVPAHPIIRASPGPPLGTTSSRRRAVGRLGGLIGISDSAALARLTAKLGPAAQTIAINPASTGTWLAADWDCCWRGEERIDSLTQWQSIADADRFAEIEGAFTVAWLSSDGTFLMARDAIGERTLYYAALPTGLVFASTIHALLATGLLRPTLNLPAVAAYLCYAYIPGRDTLIEGIHEVLPGEIVEYRAGHVTCRNYWTIPAENSPMIDEESARTRLRRTLETAVRRRLPEGEPVGAFLSGGLDSSLVVALARQQHCATVNTWSISFGPEYPNELSFSSLVADHCRTDHRIVELSPAVVLHHLDDSIRLLSEPIGDPLTVPNALLFREAAQEVGAVFNGEGGDPCFGGPKNLPMLLAELLGGGPPGDADESNARERSYLRAHQKCFGDLDRLLCGAAAEASVRDSLVETLKSHFDDPRHTNFVTRLMAMNVAFKGGHHILPKVDALSGPFGVTPRSPLFDRAVVETAFALPPQFKLRGSVEKFVLKRAVADLLPREILERPKSGMLVPVEAWFQGPLLPHARERLLDGLTPYGLVQRDYLEDLLAGRLGGHRPRHGAKIWLLLTLEAWLRTVYSDCR